VPIWGGGGGERLDEGVALRVECRRPFAQGDNFVMEALWDEGGGDSGATLTSVRALLAASSSAATRAWRTSRSALRGVRGRGAAAGPDVEVGLLEDGQLLRVPLRPLVVVLLRTRSVFAHAAT
jgi:hypothetical protein